MNITSGADIIAIIILLNMLIAILENSYTKIIEKANKEWQLEKTKLILSLMMNNIIGKKKYKTKISDNVFVGSNTSLVAPVKLERDSIVGAGSVITRNVKKKSLAITRTTQIEIKNYKRKKKS